MGTIKFGPLTASALACVFFLLTACSGGGDDDEPNQAPSANAGADINVAELSLVTLDGSASTDPNVDDTMDYAWTQTGGQSISINGANLAQATFTAPDVVFGSPEELIFQLTVTDGGGLSSSDSVTITVVEPGPAVTITGTAEYEFVPANNNCQGLAFPSTRPRPIRGATIQAFRASDNALLAETTSDDTGAYSFTIDSQLSIFLRVRAELKRSGSPSWDVEVRDNTSDTGLMLNQRPLYALDTQVFNSGVVDMTRDILATTGWGGTSYTGVRAAAPFSILDTIYDSIQLVLTADPTVNFAELDAFWSVNNSSVQGMGSDAENLDSGELGGSFYTRIRDEMNSQITYSSLFLLGMDGDDTEEFDVNVIAHEWGHYFEDNLSRSDSLGGIHALGQRLDARLAFGEGWGTAIAGMATGNPIYCDTEDPDPPLGSSSGFGVNLESPNPLFTGIKGWYNEIVVMSLLYDLWDTNVDGVDTDSIGFLPIYNVMTNEQSNTDALTSIFSFMTAIKAQNSEPFIDALLVDNGITTSLDDFGSNETNDSDPITNVNDVLPIYTNLAPTGVTVNICTNNQFDRRDGNITRDGNKLAERRYLRIDIPSDGNYLLRAENSNPVEIAPPNFDCEAVFDNNPNDPNAHRYSDPDFLLFSTEQFGPGSVISGGACTPNVEEVGPVNLTAGTYIMDLSEFRFADEDTVSSFSRSCFDVSVTPQ